MITIQANNFPIYDIQSGAVFEPLFLPPNGSRTKFCVGWSGLGRFTAGSLRIWKNGLSLNPLTAFSEEANGVFFNFAVAPSASDLYTDYLVSYVPQTADKAFALGSVGSTYAGEEYFFFPNWLQAVGIGDGFWIGRWQAARNTATNTSEGAGTTPVSKQGIIPWCSLTFSTAQTQAAAKGTGFHLVRNREWANVALWANLFNLYPVGNSVSGVDGLGVAGTPDPTVSGRCLTGTGPVSWNHNLQTRGIADMVGNVWEWIDGLQLIGGVLWIFDSNNSLVSTGVSPSFGSSGGSFNLLRTDYPNECVPATGSGTVIKGSDGFWYTNTGTMGLLRGGAWPYGSLAGLFTFSVGAAPSASDTSFGFRLAKSL